MNLPPVSIDVPLPDMSRNGASRIYVQHAADGTWLLALSVVFSPSTHAVARAHVTPLYGGTMSVVGLGHILFMYPATAGHVHFFAIVKSTIVWA